MITTKADSGWLDELLDELARIEAHIERIPSIQLSGVPGRKPSSARMATGDDRDGMAHLQAERNVLLERMSTSAIPVNCWVKYRKEVLYLHYLEASGSREKVHELYRMPARWAKWIPEDVEENPSITERRALYASRSMGQIGIWFAGVLVAIALVVAALIAWSWPVSVILVVAGGALFLGCVGYVLYRETRQRSLEAILADDGPNYPFDEIAPGTGEPSEKLAYKRQRRKEREWEKELARIAPEPQRPLVKVADYDYEYAGYRPGSEATVRVRIYEDEASKAQAPVIVLSQSYPPGGTSITNLVEAVAAEVVLSEMADLIPSGRMAASRALRKPPVHVVEHYSSGLPLGLHAEGAGDSEDEQTAIVTFSDYRIQSPEGLPEVEDAKIGGEEVTILRSNSTERPRFGEPSWHHLGRDGAKRLIGEDF